MIIIILLYCGGCICHFPRFQRFAERERVECFIIRNRQYAMRLARNGHRRVPCTLLHYMDDFVYRTAVEKNPCTAAGDEWKTAFLNINRVVSTRPGRSVQGHDPDYTNTVADDMGRFVERTDVAGGKKLKIKRNISRQAIR